MTKYSCSKAKPPTTNNSESFFCYSFFFFKFSCYVDFSCVFTVLLVFYILSFKLREYTPGYFYGYLYVCNYLSNNKESFVLNKITTKMGSLPRKTTVLGKFFEYIRNSSLLFRVYLLSHITAIQWGTSNQSN